MSLRFILPLGLALASLAYVVIPLVDNLTLKWFVRDIEIRAHLIATTAGHSITEALASRSKAKLAASLDRLIQDERLYAVGLCDRDNKLTYKTQTFPDSINCEGTSAIQTKHIGVVPMDRGPVHVSAMGLEDSGRTLGRLLLVHDMSWVQRRSSDTKWYLFYLFAIIGAVTSLITVLVAHLSWRGWLAGVRSMLKGDGLLAAIRGEAHNTSPAYLLPVAKDLRDLMKDLEADKRMRDEQRMSWTSASLKAILHDHLAGDQVLILSNRQPYAHIRNGEKIEVQVPASGLVTALEPVMRACSGIWIAHGSGSADREVVDARSHVEVPPDDPAYPIRRIWLTVEEERGYYYGFANEGLWPLCHMANIRPVFRSSDWHSYKDVNERFAMAVIEEATTDNPVVLVQDYHLALAPKMIRDHLPNATIITFWHIPWPNSERYAICPMSADILEGLLGSSIIGFHTRFHCNNFIESVDRLLEARIDRDISTISYGGKLSAVNPYPISIEWPSRWLPQTPTVAVCRTAVLARHRRDSECILGVGVERLDYTKGIVERFLAVERLFELHPEWIGQFSFIQIAAPSRSMIPEYHRFSDEVTALAARINSRFRTEPNRPIELIVQHHEPPELMQYYRAAHLCLVSSLHDGMNLVAKEFVAARDDDQGVLILSQFTGAARELLEALIVNPYDIDQCAAALHRALTMPAIEQRARMRSMRGVVQEFNVYRWAGRMLMDAARIRQRANLIRQMEPRIERFTGSSL